MNAANRQKLQQLSAEKRDTTSAVPAIVSNGEAILYRAHEIAHDIEERVRRVLSGDDDHSNA